MILDFATASLVLAGITLLMTIPVTVLAFRIPYIPHHVAVMLSFVLVALTVAGLLGAWGRALLVETLNVDLDGTIRIALVSLRLFAIGGLGVIIYEMNKARHLPPMHRRKEDE